MKRRESARVGLERPRVRQQVVRETHRLSALQMGVAGKPGLDVRRRRFDQRRGEREHAAGEIAQRLAHVEPQRDRGLVVAAARGVDAQRGIADALAQPALDPGVDVLVGALDFERAALGFGEQARQPFENRLGVVAREHRALEQHARVSEARGQVMTQEPAIERERGGEAIDARVDTALEPSAPELPTLAVLLGARHRSFLVFARRSRLRRTRPASGRRPPPPSPTPTGACARTARSPRSISAALTISGGAIRMLVGRTALISRPFSSARAATGPASVWISAATNKPSPRASVTPSMVASPARSRSPMTRAFSTSPSSSSVSSTAATAAVASALPPKVEP